MVMTSRPLIRTHRRIAAVAAAVVLLAAVAASADDEFHPAISFFADGLTPASSWADILKTKQVRPDFPFIDFGGRYFAIADLCVEGGMVRVADPARDSGVRLAAATLPGQWPATAATSVPPRTAAAGPVAA